MDGHHSTDSFKSKYSASHPERVAHNELIWSRDQTRSQRACGGIRVLSHRYSAQRGTGTTENSASIRVHTETFAPRGLQVGMLVVLVRLQEDLGVIRISIGPEDIYTADIANMKDAALTVPAVRNVQSSLAHIHYSLHVCYTRQRLCGSLNVNAVKTFLKFIDEQDTLPPPRLRILRYYSLSLRRDLFKAAPEPTGGWGIHTYRRVLPALCVLMWITGYSSRASTGRFRDEVLPRSRKKVAGGVSSSAFCYVFQINGEGAEARIEPGTIVRGGVEVEFHRRGSQNSPRKHTQLYPTFYLAYSTVQFCHTDLFDELRSSSDHATSMRPIDLVSTVLCWRGLTQQPG
ncbi:hypothetical protein R3P38DRAFT_2780312 [Favolaschia claudopus]|uniref:Uncharacterized protein n=1 Tax=Favolaschia claudopus TaxID=2862362 RepID=A0AAW0BAI3_9AGAR